jgi:hypothetical protein
VDDAVTIVTVQFNYTFATGRTITGTVSGDLQSDNVTLVRLFGLNAVYSGEPNRPLAFDGSFGSGTLQFAMDASNTDTFFGGFENNPDTVNVMANFGFQIISGLPTAQNAVIVGTFKTNHDEHDSPAQGDVRDAEAFRPSAWSAQRVSTPAPRRG